jgi:hypothetical protein
MTDPTATPARPDPAPRLSRSARAIRGARAAPARRPFVSAVARFAAVLAAALVPALAAAQAAGPDADLPGRVGRVADLAGELFLSAQERAADWTGVGLNTTITTGDNLWVSAAGRAEVDYGGGQFRLAGDTNLHVARLDDTQLALFVAQGHVIVRVRVLDGGEAARVDTPNAQVQLLRPGLYRIDVGPDRQVTQLVVREGEANVWLPAGAQQVLPGQTAIVTGADSPSGEVRNGAAQDSFDAWSASRDRRYEGSRSAAYVSRQMVGAADLDEYGTWNTDATYGAVWFPTRVADDWAPYRYGSWSWLPGWGWTWVDDAPWGYAPFHYGRWAFVGSRWGWIPGGYIARPVWAPALVGWYGGSGWSVSVRAGAPVYGWVPLGWGDPYLPSWNNCSRRCWTLYNRPYAVNHAERPHAPPARYSNYVVPGAITAVGGATLAGRKPVAFNRVAVPRDIVASAPVLATAPAVKPVAVPSPRTATAAPQPAERYAPSARPAYGAQGGRAGQAPAIPGAPQGAGFAGAGVGAGGNATVGAGGNASLGTSGSAIPASPAVRPAPTPAAGVGAGGVPAASGGSAAAPAWRAAPPARYDPKPVTRTPAGAVAAPPAPVGAVAAPTLSPQAPAGAPAAPALTPPAAGSIGVAPATPRQGQRSDRSGSQQVPLALPVTPSAPAAAMPRQAAPQAVPRALPAPAAPPMGAPQAVPQAVPRGAAQGSAPAAPAVPHAGAAANAKPVPKTDSPVAVPDKQVR